ncbi:hypothetical protein HO133_010025 [Letharia lupina]|uniref:N-acetyltransferase domain-containing protein n=1 Tax=Letharia lupina TaxID=560253 RepID=A0A8H6CKD9_9LECA|nr:uncharacterized protein HO133_010025 [Letharia lupina]KAF6224831.1 hypothetical protein HO133_010025 [Letharia lupina]
MMPQDLFSDSLVASPESQTPRLDVSEGSTATGNDGYNDFTIHRQEGKRSSAQQLRTNRAKVNERNDLHPYVQTLSLSNLESCVALENAVFSELERCAREKFIYRLTTCPELCLGLFSSTPPNSPNASIPTFSTARPADSASPDLKSVLIAMVISTKTMSPTVTDESMDVAPNWKINLSNTSIHGHREDGRTIAIHSLSVLPAFQGRGLGKTIMKAYQQRMETSGIADRMALLAHDHLEEMYEGMGFENKGKSDVRFAGGGWNSLTYEFAEHGPGS